MKWVFGLIITALFLAIPVATASHYTPYNNPYSSLNHHTSYHGSYGGADVVFRGEVTRIQRIGGINPRVEVTFRVRERIRANPSSTVVVTFSRHRDHWGYYTDDVPFVRDGEYVVGVVRHSSRYRLVWYEQARYHSQSYYPPTFHRPPAGITIPNPHTTNTCSVVDVAGQVVVVCPLTQQTTQRPQPLTIGNPRPIVTTSPRVPIAAFPWLH